MPFMKMPFLYNWPTYCDIPEEMYFFQVSQIAYIVVTHNILWVSNGW